MTLTIVIPRRLLEKSLRRLLPVVRQVAALYQQNVEADGLTPKLREWLGRYNVKSWTEAYEAPSNYAFIHLGAMLAQEDVPAALQRMPSADLTSPEGLQAWIDGICAFVEQYLDDDTDDYSFMDAEEPVVWEEVGVDDEGRPITKQGFFLAAALVLVFNYFAFMVHRKSMFQLVAEAKAGNEKSFLRAIQTDKHCLSDIPYFRAHLQRAVDQGRVDFLRRVAEYQQKPTFQSGIELGPLYLILALLEFMRLLDAFAADQEKFAAFCQSLGLYGPEDDSVDVVDSLMRTVRRFKSQYQTLAPPLRSHIRLIVKDTN